MVLSEAYTSLSRRQASSPQKSRSDLKVGSDKVASGPKGTGLPQAMNHHAALLHGYAIATSVPRPLVVYISIFGNIDMDTYTIEI